MKITAIRRHSLLLAGLLVIPLSMTLAQDASNISATRHNLTASGPGPIRVAGESEVCKFCHTPHSSNPVAPLWNRHAPGTYYQTYTSSTLAATVGQPSGASRLCLSCHDGTIALTQTYNPRNAPQGSVFLSAGDRGYIGTDLSDDHPISFVYDDALATQKGGLITPSALPRQLELDENSQLQCTTCHNPHDDRFGRFLRMNNVESAMCRTCHTRPGWAGSSHAMSAASLISAQRDRWENVEATTVRQAACEACHRPHTAGGRQRLLRHEAEEDNCLSCHDGTVAAANVAIAFNKISTHPIAATTGVHDPTENPAMMSEHVECSDCHNPHTVSGALAAGAPFVKPAMRGATGVSGTQATHEYQVCYKCHGRTASVASPVVDRVLANTNVEAEFSPANAGYHPVETQGKNPDVPSLIQPYTTSSRIYCTDCHNSDSSATGPRGPHGSSHTPLLVRNYATMDYTPESPAAYALCYQCHSRQSILADDSFEGHSRHIEKVNAPCSVCHDPHGVSATQTSANRGTHLINFDRTVVKPVDQPGEGPWFEDDGSRRGRCTLTCHGKKHEDRAYKPRN